MTLPIIAIVLSMWVIVGIGVAVFMITPRQRQKTAQWFNVTARPPENPKELSDLPKRLTMPPPAAEPPPPPATPTNRNRP